jgi:two-component system response regulator NreC
MPEEKNHAKYSVFLADDHALLKRGLKRIIEENPQYKVIGDTSNGQQIIPKIKTLHPNLIILDLSLPDLNGMEALQKIRKFDKKTKILILTMHKNEEYVYDCLINGAQGYILKEDADTELVSALRAITRDEIYVSSSFADKIIRKFVERRTNIKNKKGNAMRQTLTPREYEVLKLVAEGNSNKQVGIKLNISIRTVEHHRLSIMRKINVTNTAGLVRYALRHKVID